MPNTTRTLQDIPNNSRPASFACAVCDCLYIVPNTRTCAQCGATGKERKGSKTTSSTPKDCKCGAKYVTGLVSAVNGQIVDAANQFTCAPCYNIENSARLKAEETVYLEMNGMTAAECRAALRMGYNTLDGIKPEFKADLESRLAAIEDRLRRLTLTEAKRP